MSNNIIFFVGECYKAHPLLVSLFSLTEPWRRQNKHSYVHVGGEEGQARRGWVIRCRTASQSWPRDSSPDSRLVGLGSRTTCQYPGQHHWKIYLDAFLPTRHQDRSNNSLSSANPIICSHNTIANQAEAWTSSELASAPDFLLWLGHRVNTELMFLYFKDTDTAVGALLAFYWLIY